MGLQVIHIQELLRVRSEKETNTNHLLLVVGTFAWVSIAMKGSDSIFVRPFLAQVSIITREDVTAIVYYRTSMNLRYYSSTVQL